jgi:hypothetical protein
MKEIISPSKNNTPLPASSPRRLSMGETATAIGGNLGDLLKILHGGPKTRDPTFPPKIGQHFREEEVLAWVKARDERAAQQSTPTAPPPVATAAPLDRRATTPDRRPPNV